MSLHILLTDPELQSSVLPLAVAFVLAGLLRLTGAPRAAAAVALAFLTAYAVIVGLPALPPRAATQKLFYLVALALAAGVALDLAGAPRRALAAAVLVLPPLALAWLGWTRIAGLEPPVLAALTLVTAAGWVALWRLDRAARREGAIPMAAPVMVLVASLAVGAVALIGATASVAQLGFAAAAACGGLLLWNWPRPRWPAGAALALGSGLVPVLLAGQLAFYSRAPVVALVPVVGVFFADSLAARLPLGNGPVGRALAPVAVGLIALVPAAAAVLLARFLAGPADPYAG